MKRFHFELESVLRLYRRKEDRAAAAVAEILRLHHQLQNRLATQRRNLAADQALLRAAVSGTVDLRTMQDHSSAAMALLRQEEGLRPAFAELQARLDQARAALRECARRRRSIELLRDRRYAEWCDRTASAAQRAADDLSAQQRLETL